VVSDALAEAIGQAQRSIRIASGHLVSEPIAQAVLDALSNNPSLEVEIALDCQETSKNGAIRDIKAAIENRGGSIFYKCNTYRWHYVYAQQMHHKYVIIDDEILYTGSYNFSDNAENNTFENVIMFKGAEHASLVASYVQNHEMVRNYGRRDDIRALTELREEIEFGDSVPLSWGTPISMTLDTFLALKDLIREHCPATKFWESTPEAKTYNKYFNSQPQWFSYCKKYGYPWPSVPVNMRVQ
jgi:phosphatidylserine/phosphatidylglycerophosphate/cardiolipin synthase-like enzyme